MTPTDALTEKRCPFCGSRPLDVSYSSVGTELYCGDDGCHGTFTFPCTPEELLKMWSKDKPLSFEANKLLDGPWENPDEETPIPRSAMYALAVAAHYLTGAMAQRQDCAHKTVSEVKDAVRWLDDFAKRLNENWNK